MDGVDFTVLKNEYGKNGVDFTVVKNGHGVNGQFKPTEYIISFAMLKNERGYQSLLQKF